jgi:hypothetical protein
MGLKRARALFFVLFDSFTLGGALGYDSPFKEQFNLDCTSHQKGKWVSIYIRTSSMERFRSIVLPYFNPNMLYKLKK